VSLINLDFEVPTLIKNMAIYFYNLFNRVIKIQADALYSLIPSPYLAGAPKQQQKSTCIISMRYMD